MKRILIVLLVMGIVAFAGNVATGSDEDSTAIEDGYAIIITENDCLANDLYWNYQLLQILCYPTLFFNDDIVGSMLIPQNETALKTYQWYRVKKKYSVAKSVRLTKRYYMLNY